MRTPLSTADRATWMNDSSCLTTATWWTAGTTRESFNLHDRFSRVPTSQGKQGKWPTKFCQGKHREFGNFAKTQGILFAEVVNFLILKVKDIAIFAAKFFIFFSRSWIGLPSQFCVCDSHKLCKLAQGKFAV